MKNSECQECDGTGVINREEGCIDGLYYPAIVDATCEACGGTGSTMPDNDFFTEQRRLREEDGERT